jgi:hypothetical protein
LVIVVFIAEYFLFWLLEHCDLVVLVTTQAAEGQWKLLGMLPDRQIGTVEKLLLTIPERLRAKVRAVCIGDLALDEKCQWKRGALL